MTENPFLFRLAERVHSGAERLPSELRIKSREAVLREQKADGGWGGREGDSDLYYTSFAIRSLTMLEAFDGTILDRATEFLSRGTALNNIVDLLSWLYSAFAVAVSGGQMIVPDVGEEWSSGIALNWSADVRSVVMVSPADVPLCAWNLRPGGLPRNLSLPSTSEIFTPTLVLP